MPSLHTLETDRDKKQLSPGDNAEPRGTSNINYAEHKGTFETIGDVSFYSPIKSYEGKHRYDPNFQWESKEEIRLVRKVIDSA